MGRIFGGRVHEDASVLQRAVHVSHHRADVARTVRFRSLRPARRDHPLKGEYRQAKRTGHWKKTRGSLTAFFDSTYSLMGPSQLLV